MTTDDGDGFGTLERRDGRAVLHFTRPLRHRPEQVWQALTDPVELAAWFPTTIEGELAPGAALRFVLRELEAPAFSGEAITVDPPSLLVFQWGDELLRFELEPDGEGTLLHFSAAFYELGKAARDGGGWHDCLDRLGDALDGTTTPGTAGDRWRKVRDAYRERFGPDASTIGPPDGWEEAHGPAEAEPPS